MRKDSLTTTQPLTEKNGRNDARRLPAEGRKHGREQPTGEGTLEYSKDW